MIKLSTHISIHYTHWRASHLILQCLVVNRRRLVNTYEQINGSDRENDHCCNHAMGNSVLILIISLIQSRRRRKKKKTVQSTLDQPMGLHRCRYFSTVNTIVLHDLWLVEFTDMGGTTINFIWINLCLFKSQLYLEVWTSHST